MKAAVAVALRVLGWAVTLVGCIIIIGALTGLYMLLVKGAAPGERVFLDAEVPPLRGALLHLANGLVLTFAPFILRGGFRRWRHRPSNNRWRGP